MKLLFLRTLVLMASLLVTSKAIHLLSQNKIRSSMHTHVMKLLVFALPCRWAEWLVCESAICQQSLHASCALACSDSPAVRGFLPLLSLCSSSILSILVSTYRDSLCAWIGSKYSQYWLFGYTSIQSGAIIVNKNQTIHIWLAVIRSNHQPSPNRATTTPSSLLDHNRLWLFKVGYYVVL